MRPHNPPLLSILNKLVMCRGSGEWVGVHGRCYRTELGKDASCDFLGLRKQQDVPDSVRWKRAPNGILIMTN